MKATEIDGKLSISRFSIDFDKAFAKTDVAPIIIFLGLYRCRNNGVNSDDGRGEQGPACSKRFRRLAIKRALFVDGVAKRERRRKGDKAVEMQFQIIEMSEGITFQNGLIAREHDSEFRFDHTLGAQVAHPSHEGRSPI